MPRKAAEHKIPPHLKKYVVTQNYRKYTPEDHAVWRYIMRQLKHFLEKHGHPCYRDGLKKTGISIEKIPRISDIDKSLKKFGWGAVPVSGFIPPAAFMEFQARGFLPIASDMRSLEHLLYTPAPDIVHEAAGHAPIIVDEQFAKYLKAYAQVAANALISHQDMEQYKLIRKLSDMKEDPHSSKAAVEKVERELSEIGKKIDKVSEAGLLSRMNWWTAEYGLIGDIKNPKLFGAGLLSSLGEARDCLKPKVKKIPFTVDCIKYSYDITEPQPQLFVTPDFEELISGLDDLASTMAFRKGGEYGLLKAKESATVNTIELDSGLQISGVLADHLVDRENFPCYLKLAGSCQIGYDNKELPGQGTRFHKSGFGSPVGNLVGHATALHRMTKDQLLNLGLKKNSICELNFASGVKVQGRVKKLLFREKKLVLISFDKCTVKLQDSLLFSPDWGDYDMAVGSSVQSVFGGPLDREKFGDTDDFIVARVPKKKYSLVEKANHKTFSELRQLREKKRTKKFAQETLEKFAAVFCKNKNANWLVGIEILELAKNSELNDKIKNSVLLKLQNIAKDEMQKKCIEDGLALA